MSTASLPPDNLRKTATELANEKLVALRIPNTARTLNLPETTSPDLLYFVADPDDPTKMVLAKQGVSGAVRSTASVKDIEEIAQRCFDAFMKASARYDGARSWLRDYIDERIKEKVLSGALKENASK